MQASTGHLVTVKSSEMRRDTMTEALQSFDSQNDLIPLTDEQYEELVPLTRDERKGRMRNKPCICGSGEKFKKCCWSKYSPKAKAL